MGFFDKILNALGFEDEDDVKVERGKKQKEDKSEKVKINSKFDLEEIKVKKEEKLYKPQTQNEIENIVADLINGDDVEIDFSEFEDVDRVRALDFLSGVAYILKADIEKKKDFLYSIKIDKNKN